MLCQNEWRNGIYKLFMFECVFCLVYHCLWMIFTKTISSQNYILFLQRKLGSQNLLLKEQWVSMDSWYTLVSVYSTHVERYIYIYIISRYKRSDALNDRKCTGLYAMSTWLYILWALQLFNASFYFCTYLILLEWYGTKIELLNSNYRRFYIIYPST